MEKSWESDIIRKQVLIISVTGDSSMLRFGASAEQQHVTSKFHECYNKEKFEVLKMPFTSIISHWLIYI